MPEQTTDPAAAPPRQLTRDPRSASGGGGRGPRGDRRRSHKTDDGGGTGRSRRGLSETAYNPNPQRFSFSVIELLRMRDCGTTSD